MSIAFCHNSKIWQYFNFLNLRQRFRINFSSFQSKLIFCLDIRRISLDSMYLMCHCIYGYNVNALGYKEVINSSPQHPLSHEGIYTFFRNKVNNTLLLILSNYAGDRLICRITAAKFGSASVSNSAEDDNVAGADLSPPFISRWA